jgi:membrane protein DedA with SNARE-associated domain
VKLEDFLADIQGYLISIPLWVRYLIVLFGSFVEGESIVLTAGFLSYQGYLSLPLLILVSFAGSLFADQLLFFIGRHYGPAFIERRPRLKERSQRAFYHLRKHSTLFILSFRFIYGIRTLSPIVIGASGVAIRRFVILNFIAAAIWAIISCCVGYVLGYFFADNITYFLKNLGIYQKYIAMGLLGVMGAIVLFIYIRKKMGEKETS